ncbi:sodium/calcium exchanger NCL1-like [Ricinus communis]|uniref:sodium/calcium exchanger NCL1-like n=1 Tax=Ricinus communis TaxID=3988 RepID=UPI00201A6592|nr:sodium/calcium exchanger NCL1-like [Ricinus communis]
MIKAAFNVLLVVLAIHLANSRSIRDESSILLSDGMDQKNQSVILQLDDLRTSVTCEPTYGFLPCTTEVWGQLFLMIVYEYLLSLSAKYISEGSELFLETSGTENIFSANLFQMLGMFPQVILVLVAAVGGEADTVETMAEMGMGLLAGSVIMNLTLIWGSVVAFGSYDLSQTSTSSNTESQNKFSLTGYGVTTDDKTKHTAGIMLLSMIPFLLLQLAKILSSSSAKKVVLIVSLIITLIYLIAYLIYQALTPWIRERRLQYLMRKYVQKNLLQALCTPDGKPDEANLKELFRKIDQNSNSQISASEMRALMLGIQIEEAGSSKDEFVSKVMEEFDISGDSSISENEFVQGLSKWLSEANVSGNDQTKKTNKKSSTATSNSTSTSSNSKGTTEEQQGLVTKSQESKDTDNSVLWDYAKAVFLIISGTAVTFLIATPLMTTLQDFATAINIPSFLVSYFVVPLALSFKQAYRAITSAREKTENAASLTLSELYGGVFMNNVMGLAIFLLLVCIKDLSWDVSAEILVVLIICSGMGIYATFSTKFPFWTSIIAYALYPISLAFIYVLTTYCGWG